MSTYLALQINNIKYEKKCLKALLASKHLILKHEHFSGSIILLIINNYNQ